MAQHRPRPGSWRPREQPWRYGGLRGAKVGLSSPRVCAKNCRPSEDFPYPRLRRRFRGGSRGLFKRFRASKSPGGKTGAIQIHAYDAETTVAGQGSCFVEWEEQGLNADTMLIAVGGGGLIADALGWFQGQYKIVAVEPERCATLHAALDASAPMNVEVSSVAENALGAQKIGTI